MPKPLTDAAIARLPAPAKGSKVTYATGVPKGFGVCVTKTGAKSFVLNYYTKGGRERRLSIGAFPTWKLAAARKEASRLRGEIDRGGDPLGDLQQSRAAPTVRDLVERFRENHLPRKRTSTQCGYRSQLDRHIMPALGALKVAEVSFADISRLHASISRRAPTAANRTIALVSRIFTLAMRWGMRTDNPCRGVERNPDNPQERYLMGSELVRLATALAEFPDETAANAIRLLLLTGARCGETLAAKWHDLDLERGVWCKPSSHTKQKKTHRVPLSEAAVTLLEGMAKSAPIGAVYVFPSLGGGNIPHRRDLKRAWQAVRKAADLPGVRLHDLRHSYASVLVSAGMSLPIIGALLGHTSPTTTQRYAHLADDPLRHATERAAAVIMATPSAKVVPLKCR
jgi:integrase